MSMVMDCGLDGKVNVNPKNIILFLDWLQIKNLKI